jgi:hypothetical protein
MCCWLTHRSFSMSKTARRGLDNIMSFFAHDRAFDRS